MLSTVQLFLALGFGRFALVADLVVTGAAVAVATVVAVRSGRTSRPQQQDTVVAEAEAVVAGAPSPQPTSVS